MGIGNFYMEMIGLIAALPLESKALFRYIKKWKRTTIGTYRAYRFQLNDRNCLLVTSGMGLECARDATHALIAGSNLQLLVSFGIAGAVHSDLNIGDVVVARNTCLLKKGLLGQFRSLACLSEEAWNAAVQILQQDDAHLVSGSAITTQGSQAILQVLEEITHPVLEMETTGIAQVASEMGIPLVSIRSVSDGPRSPIPFDLEAILDEKENIRVGKLLGVVFRHPQIIFASRKMIQNSRKAADHAARALVAVLIQPSPILSPRIG